MRPILFLFVLISVGCASNKRNSIYWYNRGVNQYNKKHYQKAIVFLNKSIAIDSTNTEAICERGCAKDELGLYLEAIKDFDTAIALQPNYADAIYNRGNAKFDMEEYLLAFEDYQLAFKLNPNDKDYRAMLKQTAELLSNKKN